jgi:seryl-tRNA synthetase
MIDIQLLRDKPDWYKQKTTEKNNSADIDGLLKLDTERLSLLSVVESLRKQRNQNADTMKQSAANGKPDQSLIDEGKRIKVELAEKEALLDKYTQEWSTLLRSVPNPSADDVPIGPEDASQEIKVVGAKKKSAIDHVDFATKRDWLDFERGAKVAGAKFYFLKGDLARLELAIVQYALDKIASKGFTFMTVPHLVNSKTADGAGFAPRGDQEGNEYFVDGEDLTAIGTAEAPLTGYHADEIIDESQLPLKYVGYSPCYRREAGTYGKHARGLFRVHQFNKLEMYVFCTPEDSIAMHEEILSIEEEIWNDIGIPYHVINIASGDLGAPAAKKYDIEYWSPVDQTYRELTSCSNCTDFQARRSNIRLRRKDGTVEPLHTLNGTAVSMARTLIVIIENFQNDDGTLTIPEVIRPYMGGRERI